MWRTCCPALICAIATTMAGAQEGASAMPKRPSIPPRSECFFGLHFDLHPNENDTELGAACTDENVGALLDRVDPDFIQWDCKGHRGYTGYPTEVGWPSPGIVGDSLAVVRAATAARNIGLYIHYSGVWDTRALEAHPDWGVVRPDGTRDPNNTSVFGGYADGLLIPQLKEVVDQYNLDGMWVDGECWATQLDWCDAAKKQFTEETGLTEIPTKRGDPNWLEWKAFHRRQFERYLIHWVDALHAHKPSLQIASNWAYTTFQPKEVVAKVDYLSGDYSPMLSVDRARVEARYLANTGKTWDLGMWGFNWVDGTGHSLKTSEHHMQEAGVVLMQGGAFWIYNQPTRSGWVNPFLIETLGQVSDFCRTRKEVSFKSTTVPQVAVLYSSETQADRSDAVLTPYGCVDEIEGALQALLELHYSVDLMPEHLLAPRLAEFPLVVVPDSYKLTDDFRLALVEYVRGGGKLLLLGQQCARLFAEHLGAELGPEDHAGAVELLSGDALVSVGGPWATVTPTSARPVAWWHPTRDTRKDAQVAATIAPLGEGQIAAVYGPVALTFFRSHHPYLRDFVGRIAKELFPNPTVEVDAPPCLDVALRHTVDGRLAVHLLNLNGLPLGSRSVTDCILPLTDVRVTVNVPAQPRTVWLVPSGGELPFEYEQGRVTVTVPKVAIHEVLVIE